MDQIMPLLQVGAQFEMSSFPYEVAFVGEDFVRVAPMKGGTIKHLPFKALKELMNEKALEIIYTPPSASDVSGTYVRSGLSDRQISALNRRLRYVREVYKLEPETPCSQAAIAKHLPTIAKELGDVDPPGVSTVAAWMKRWRDGGRIDAALVPPLKPSRVDNSKLPAELVELISKSINAVWLNEQQNSISAIYADVLVEVAKHNVDAPKPLTAPSRETVRKMARRVDKFEADRARHGPAYAKRKHRAAGLHFHATEPLEVCMADGQIMDVILVEERDDDLPPKDIGRPFLTAIIDVRTRCALSTYVSTTPFSGGTLLKALSEAVVASPQRPKGIMRKLIVDNGSDYQASAFFRCCSRLDITLEPCPPKMPNAKAIVERFFRTVSEDLIHKLPGTTFSNPSDRGDYDSQAMARITLKDLRQHLQVWIDEVYHARPHRELGRAPIKVWNEDLHS